MAERPEERREDDGRGPGAVAVSSVPAGAPLTSDRGPLVPPTLERVAAWSWRLVVVLAALALVVYALIRLRLVVLPVVVALLVCTLLVPPVHWLRARGVKRGLSTWAVLLGSAVAFAGLGLLLVPQLAGQLGQLGERLSEGVDEVQRWAVEGPLGLSQDQIDDLRQRVQDQVSSNGSQLATGVVSGATLLVEVVAGLLLSVVLVYFFLKDGDRITGWLVEQLPLRHHDAARAAGRRAWSTFSGYIRGVALTGLVDAVLIGIVLAVVGVPLVVPLAVLTFLGAFLPVVGAFLAGLFAALVALVNGGPTDALIVVAAVVVIQQLEGDVLAPKLIGNATKLHPVVVLLALTGGAGVAGVAGAFLSVPVVAVVAAVVGELRSRHADEEAEAAASGREAAARPGATRLARPRA